MTPTTHTGITVVTGIAIAATLELNHVAGPWIACPTLAGLMWFLFKHNNMLDDMRAGFRGLWLTFRTPPRR